MIAVFIYAATYAAWRAGYEDPVSAGIALGTVVFAEYIIYMAAENGTLR